MNLKTIGLIVILVALLFLTATVLAGVKSTRLKMDLNETCFEHVEKIAGEIDGVIEIVYDNETEELEVVYEEKKTTIKEIELVISEAGFDTPSYPASETASQIIQDSCKTGNKNTEISKLVN